MVPFIEVLLHTFIDCMREEEGREINHHGHPIQIPGEENGEVNGEENGEKNEEENGHIRRIFVVSEDKQVANILGLYLVL